MGLDITAYSKLRHIGNHADEEWCEDKNHVGAFSYAAFPDSYRDLPVLSTTDDWIKGGCFEITEETQHHSFRAGSYGGYNRWRENLQQQFNPDRQPDGPFYELIWFADNEGTIGPDAARDLLADFREHEPSYRPYLKSQDPFKDWLRACELAADSGLIRFH